jgi:hypothetical protein
MNKFVFRALLIMFAVTPIASTNAAELTYTIDGTLSPGTGDPWGLINPTAATMSFTVDATGLDTSVFLEYGTFPSSKVVGGSLSIEGFGEAEFQSSSHLIIFFDNLAVPEIEPGIFDAMSITGNWLFEGNIATAGFGAGIDDTSFSFTDIHAPYPIFGSRVNLGESINFKTYDFLTAPGAILYVSPDIDAIPEPSSLVLMSIGAIGMTVVAIRRRRRTA